MSIPIAEVNVGFKTTPEVTRSMDYQTEVFQESLKRNVIVTMDSCSERINIAVRRIRAQLQKGDDRLCWFMVPNDPLGETQYQVLKASLPPVNIQFLSSEIGVEKWKDQSIRNKILLLEEKASTVVVSTHQVFLDAITCNFVTFRMIGLLVFDEVHRYPTNHPANRIIQELSHLGNVSEVPAMLGLVGDPTPGVDHPPRHSQRVVEFNLDAISPIPALSCELPEGAQKQKLADITDFDQKPKHEVDLEESQEDDNVEDEQALNESNHRRILVESTGALLTLESAIPTLHKFCTSLSQEPHTDLRPIFTTSTEGSLYRAQVTLPNCIPLVVRNAVSIKAWKTKTWAKRDAAFEAVRAMYELKEDSLVNEHFLPLFKYPASSAAERPPKKKKQSKAIVEKTMDPWAEMRWEEGTVIYATPITLMIPDSDTPMEIDILIPVGCPPVDKILVYWNKDVEYEVVVGRSRCLGVDQGLVERAREATYNLLQTIFRPKMEEGIFDFPYLFMPRDQDQSWFIGDERSVNALVAYTKDGLDNDIGILRDTTQNGTKYIIHKWRSDISPLNNTEITTRYGDIPINSDQPLIEVVKFPERRDFLHEAVGGTTSETTVLLLPEYCTIDKIPWRYSKLALLLPGIIRRIEMALIASNLQQTLLEPVGIESVSKIITAISTPSARESTDYQRFEFLGDLVLKFLASINILDEHPFWHEGNLSYKKSKTISNSYLSRVAQDKGLARWIITDVFTGVKWKPRYIITDSTNNIPTAEKELSIKVLADVVEALIGAAYLEGGYGKALKCISTFGLNITWQPLETRINSLIRRALTSPPVSIRYLKGIEKLLGYTFHNQALLLEAITPPCCDPTSTSASYERLQFLGDAILDMVVVQDIFFDPTLLSPVDMHLFKSSVVAGNFLAFLSMRYSTSLSYPKVQPLKGDPGGFEVTTEETMVNFWKFIDLPHTEMANAKRRCSEKYESGLRDKVQSALDNDTYYPWAELSIFEADTKGKNKFFSDIVEAVMGAVFVDSRGDFEAVKNIVESLGVLQSLRRFVKDRVNMTHPVTRLEERVAPMQKGKPKYVIGFEDGEHVCTIVFDKLELAVARSSSKPVSRAMAAEMGLKELEKPEISPGQDESGEVDDGW